MELNDLPKDLRDSAVERRLKPGEVIIEEGKIPSHCYFLLKGHLDVEKRTRSGAKHFLHSIKPGEWLGNVGKFAQKKHPVTIRAKCRAIVLTFPLKIAEKKERLLLPIIAKQMAERLRYYNEIMLTSLEKKVEEARKRELMAFVMVSLFSIFSLYILLLQVLMQKVNYSLYIFIAMMVSLGGLGYTIIRRSGFAPETFGLRLKNWKKSLMKALPVTCALMAGTVVAKWGFLQLVGNTSEPLFHPLYTMIPRKSFLFFLGIYVVLVPVQEFLARGILQSVFTKLFSTENKHVVWPAIFLSNILFATLHTYVSVGLALSAFFPGLVWGWLFEKQKDLVGVTVSHLLLGTWSFAILGFSYLFSS